MYIWLKEGAEEQLANLKKQGLFGDVCVETRHNSGKKYLVTYEDVLDPAADVPNIPEELIEKVTLRDRIHRGLRTEGVYRHKGAVLLVKSGVDVYSDMCAGKFEREEWQEISISAPNVTALKAIYTMVRQGKLAPEENWEQHVKATT